MTPDELHGGEYELVAVLTHDDIAHFAVQYFLHRHSWVTWLHHLMSLATIAAAVAAGWGSAGASFAQAGLGLLAMVIVILPLHEALHALAYRLCGARDIRWSYTLRTLVVYVTAHRFVVTTKPFLFVALAPFLLNVPLVICALVWPQYAVFFLAILVFHLHGESGDWAMLNFIWIHRDRGFWTWDDADAGKSYFYGRRSAL
ncbi:MAG TPA: DUF3267 domain-containing protein [Thermoanaerobaculia bacterium]